MKRLFRFEFVARLVVVLTAIAGLALVVEGCSNKPDLPELSKEDAEKLQQINVPPMGSPKDMPPSPEDTIATDGFNPPVMAPGKGGAPQPQQ